jgi:two-component system response regulator RegX3
VHIALLEDDTDQAALIEAWLVAAGHECQAYANAAEFTAEVDNDGFDVLILDWMLPESSGIEVLEWVRQNINWPIPVIFVTQKNREEDVVLALEKGADDFIAKPVREGELVARIKAVARRANLNTRTDVTRSFGPYTIDVAAP